MVFFFLKGAFRLFVSTREALFLPPHADAGISCLTLRRLILFSPRGAAIKFQRLRKVDSSRLFSTIFFAPFERYLPRRRFNFGQMLCGAGKTGTGTVNLLYLQNSHAKKAEKKKPKDRSLGLRVKTMALFMTTTRYGESRPIDDG